MIPPHVIAGLAAIGIVGALVRPVWARIICWLLSVPPFGLGLFVLACGGIAEPFSEKQMWAVCVPLFLPIMGCAIGEIAAGMRRIKRKTLRLQ